jgi:HK97 family phage major capsid protein
MHYKIAELRNKQRDLIIEGRKKLDKITNDTPEHIAQNFEDEFDLTMAKHDDIDREIKLLNLELREESHSFDDDTRGSRVPLQDGECHGDGFPIGHSTNRWFDASTKQEVRVVQGKKKFATESSPVSVGAMLRSLITGSRNEAEKRILSEGTDSAGGFSVPTPLAGEFIDLMRARSHVFSAGARVVDLPSETLKIARISTEPTPSWRAENAIIPEGDPTLGQVLFTARSLAFITRVSRELIQDSVNIDEILERIFVQSFASEIDRVALLGSGSSPEPQGVSGASGVTSISMGTNGAALSDYSQILQALQNVEDSNSANPTAFIMAPRSKYALAGLTATDNQPLMAPAVVSAVPMLSTSKVPIDQTQGTANDASTIFLGDFSQLMVGVRSELRVEVLRERYADSHQLGFVAHARVDVQLAQPTSFVEINGIIP